MRGCEGAADWARHGEGGSGVAPAFVEARAVAVPPPARRALVTAVLAALALVALRTMR